MRLDLADQAFRAAAERWLASLTDETIADVDRLFHASPGYYPTTLLSLREEELRRRQLTSRSKSARIRSRRAAMLPVSHPAEYDWRFTPETAEQLVEVLAGVVSNGGVMLHLATPSTFVAGTTIALHHRHVLIEGNRTVVELLRTISGNGEDVRQMDLANGPWPHLAAPSAIVDPPWYPDYTLLFISAASEMCAVDATILLCQPTEASRPGVARERAMIIEALPALGLELVRHVPGILRYEMPHFERMSIRKVLTDAVVPWDWRVGDLLVLHKVSERRALERPSVQVERWIEVRVGPVRIKLRGSGTASDIEPLVPGDILDTVSRRDEIRSRIGMWTSGNRVYGIASPDAITTILTACHDDWTRGWMDSDRTAVHGGPLGLPDATSRRLHSILEQELAEHE